jgi:hypothetical protein
MLLALRQRITGSIAVRARRGPPLAPSATSIGLTNTPLRVFA